MSALESGSVGGTEFPRGTKNLRPSVPATTSMFRQLQCLEGGWAAGGAYQLWRAETLTEGCWTSPLFPAPLQCHQSGTWERGLSRGRGTTRMTSKERGRCRGASLYRRGRPRIPLPRDSPSPAERPTAPVPSQGLSHSLNTVSHCCPPWQAQICPSVPGEPCSLSLVFPYGRGDEAGRRGEKRAPLFPSQAGPSGHRLTASVRERTALPHVLETDR